MWKDSLYIEEVWQKFWFEKFASFCVNSTRFNSTKLQECKTVNDIVKWKEMLRRKRKKYVAFGIENRDFFLKIAHPRLSATALKVDTI